MKDFYLVSHYDHSCPSFCTAYRDYIEETEEPVSFHAEPVKLSLLAKYYYNYRNKPFEFEYENTWGFSYFIRGMVHSIEKAAFEAKGKYYVGYRVEFRDPEYSSDKRTWKTFNGDFWGISGQIVLKEDLIRNTMWIISGIFSDSDSARNDLKVPVEDFTDFFSDVFGEG